MLNRLGAAVREIERPARTAGPRCSSWKGQLCLAALSRFGSRPGAGTQVEGESAAAAAQGQLDSRPGQVQPLRPQFPGQAPAAVLLLRNQTGFHPAAQLQPRQSRMDAGQGGSEWPGQQRFQVRQGQLPLHRRGLSPQAPVQGR